MAQNMAENMTENMAEKTNSLDRSLTLPAVNNFMLSLTFIVTFFSIEY